MLYRAHNKKTKRILVTCFVSCVVCERVKKKKPTQKPFYLGSQLLVQKHNVFSN